MPEAAVLSAIMMVTASEAGPGRPATDPRRGVHYGMARHCMPSGNGPGLGLRRQWPGHLRSATRLLRPALCESHSQTTVASDDPGFRVKLDCPSTGAAPESGPCEQRSLARALVTVGAAAVPESESFRVGSRYRSQAPNMSLTATESASVKFTVKLCTQSSP